MLRRTVNSWRGSVTLRVESGFPERVLNLCAAHAIPFWDLTWESEIRFTFTMTAASWRKLRGLTERLDASLTVIERRGVPFFLLRFRRRYVLAAGLTLCVLFAMVGSLFVWDFRIEGNETVSREEILRCLSRHGVTIGTFGLSIRTSQLRNHVLLDIPELSYIAVNVSGFRANIQVRERVEPPEPVDKRNIGNTVADRDGMILQIKPYDGEKMVLPGTTVREGQLLISGVVDDDQAGTRFLRGMGEVYARTWYDLRCQVPATTEEKVITKTTTRYAVIIGERRINLYNSSSIPGEDCDKIVTRTKLSLPGGVTLPITIVKETVRTYTTQTAERSQEEAQAWSRAVLERYLAQEVGEGTVEEQKVAAAPVGGQYLTQLKAECTQEIGRFVEIQKESPEG